MQENLKVQDFKNKSIEILASNPRNGYLLLDIIFKYIDYQKLPDYRESLNVLFEGFISSLTIEDMDPLQRANEFFSFQRLIEFLNDLENAMNIICPEPFAIGQPLSFEFNK